MSKEYNEEIRLQSLKEFVDEYANEEELTSVGGVRATIDIIEEQLNNYKKLLNSNPSEALECLEEMENYNPCQCPECYTLGEWCREELEAIKQALLKAQKEHKALEIIKEKNVNIYQIKYMETLDDYNSVRGEEDRLTEEEFNLLKEVLE